MNVTAVHQRLTDYWFRAVVKPHSVLLMTKKNKYNHLSLPRSIFTLPCLGLFVAFLDSGRVEAEKMGLENVTSQI